MVWTTEPDDATAASDCMGILGPTLGGLIVCARHASPGAVARRASAPGHSDDQGEAQKSSRVRRSRATDDVARSGKFGAEGAGLMEDVGAAF